MNPWFSGPLKTCDAQIRSSLSEDKHLEIKMKAHNFAIHETDDLEFGCIIFRILKANPILDNETPIKSGLEVKKRLNVVKPEQA